MSSKVEISLNLSDNGSIRKKVKDSDDLNASLTKTERIISKLEKPKASSYRKAAYQDEAEEYAKARGAVGTGASSRDFAKQAQGLGGLVHVYATFAANLFAVGAAFRALSSAADTTNMVKGLEQLGAASGTNLKLLSKQLVEATGGAVSLREAMQATAQASAAGMSTENIKKLGITAQRVSTVLGVDATDALSRLSRGITKLEPELLDELGIFTKLEKATTDYAKSVGKPVSALTDFERRQAFANAVLDEANKKFGDIKIETNPYSKLLAALKDAAQTMLEVVNKFLGPVISLLAQSPSGLMLGIAGLTGLLVRQAIPALTMWRNGLHDSAEAAEESAKRTSSLYKEYIAAAKFQAEARLPEPVRRMGADAEAVLADVKEKLKAGARLYNKEFNAMMRLDVSELSKDNLRVVEETRKKLNDAANKAVQGGDAGAAQKAQARLTTFNSIAPALEKAINQQIAYDEAVKKAAPNMDKMASYHEKTAKSAEVAARKFRILAAAADDASFVGPMQAFKTMISRVNSLEGSVGRLGLAWLKFRGTMTVVARAVEMASAVIMRSLAIIGLVISAIGILTAVFSKNRDEVERSGKSLDDLKSNGENLYRTFERLDKLDPLAKLSPSNAAAATQAIESVATSMVQAIADTEKTIAARGAVDSFTNWMAGWIGKSDEDLLAKRVSKELNQILEKAATSSATAGIRLDLVKMLGLGEGSSDDEINKALTAMGAKGAKALEQIVKKYNTAAQSTKAFSESVAETERQFKALETSLKMSDTWSTTIGKIAGDYIELGKVMQGSVTDKLNAMIAIGKSPVALSILPKEMQMQLLDATDGLESVKLSLDKNATAATAARSEIAQYTDELARLNEEERKASERLIVSPQAIASIQARRATTRQNLEAAKTAQAEATANISKDSKTVDGYAKLFEEASSRGFKQASAAIANVVSAAISKAATAVEQNALSKVTRTKEVIDRQTSLEMKQLDIDLQAYRAQVELAMETKALRLVMEQRKIAEDKQAIDNDSKLSPPEKEARIGVLKARDKELTNTIAFLNSKGYLKTKNASSMVEQGVPQAEALDIFSSTAGLRVKTAEILGQKQTAKLEGEIKNINLLFENKLKDYATEAAKITNQLSELQSTRGGDAEARSMPSYLAEEKKLTEQLTQLESKRAMASVEQQTMIDAAASKYLGNNKQVIDSIKRAGEAEADRINKNNTLNAQASKLAITLRSIDDKYATSAAEAERTNAATNAALKMQDLLLDEKMQELDLAYALGKLTDEDAAKARVGLDTQRASLEYAKAELDAKYKYSQAIAEIDKQIEKAKKSNASFGAEDQKFYDDRKTRAQQELERELGYAARYRDIATKRANDNVAQMQREVAYTEVVKTAFKGLEDALVEFAKTGKLSFSSLVNTMIEGLIRIELQAMQSRFFSGIGGVNGIVSFVSGMFGGGGWSAPGVQPSGAITTPVSTPGPVVGTPLPFAKGGTFTNSIVDSPTLFKFAKGTGLMGEAGPEAIMPLKRDKNGSLGVVAQNSGGGTKVDVVVNNYSNAQAETRETTDSQGNRKIEVVIGEMVSGEMSRTGSPLQKTMANTFNSKPVVARR